MIDRSLWNDEELEIFDLFRGKCILCKQWAVTLHEICPKSKCPKTWQNPENRVPVCNRHHNWIHATGANNHAIELSRLREEQINANRS